MRPSDINWGGTVTTDAAYLESLSYQAQSLNSSLSTAAIINFSTVPVIVS